MDHDYVDLRALFQSVMEKKKFVVITTLLVFLLVMMYAISQPVKYQTSILLKINHKLSVNNLTEDPLAVKIALIQSEFILRPVIKALGLDISITPLNYFHKKKLNLINISQLEVPTKLLNKKLQLVIDDNRHYRLFDPRGRLLIQGTKNQLISNHDATLINIDNINAPSGSHFILKKNLEVDVLKSIRSHLTITDLSGSAENTVDKVALLRLSLTGRDPIAITNILTQIAKITEQQDKQLKIVEAKKTLAFLNQELPIIKLSLKEAEEKLNAYRSKYGKIDIKFQTDNLLNHLSELNKQLEIVRLKKIDLLQKFTSNHPFVIALNQEISELEKSRSELTDQLKKLPSSEQEALNLKREVSVRNSLYMNILNQIHQLEVMETGIMSDTQVLSYPSTPYAIQPMKLHIVGIFGLLIGFILGCAGVLIGRIISHKMIASAPRSNQNPAVLEVVSQHVN